MLPENLRMYFLRFAKHLVLFAFLIFSSLAVWSCGAGSCGSIDKFLNEPSCKTLPTTGTRSFKGVSSACVGSPNSKKMIINCPDDSGSQGQCGTGATGMGLISVLLPLSQSNFANCQDVLSALASGTLTGATAIYISDTTNTADTVDCSSGACVLNPTPNCYSAWDDSIPGPNGVASILNGTQFLSCTFINEDALGLTAITAGGNAWAAGFGNVTIAAGSAKFDTGWVDAQ